MGRNPSHFSSSGPGKEKIAGASTDAYPVESVSWADVVLFCNKISEKEGLKAFYHIEGETVTVLSWSGDGYRLPTEAEWEYAADGDPADLDGSAWYEQNSRNVTHPVGQKRSNRFGLYDMLGNVWEWCWDGYDEGYYKMSPSEDPAWSVRDHAAGLPRRELVQLPVHLPVGDPVQGTSRRTGTTTWAFAWPEASLSAEPRNGRLPGCAGLAG